MKATLLLATALFLISAPAPDSQTIAEFTRHFVVLDGQEGLQAAEESIPPDQPGESPASEGNTDYR